jgi:S-adenosylmethionine synthetase
MRSLFSSEAVSIGHPDKVCDQLSDAILDAYLVKDPDAKVAVECLITKGRLVIAGEVNSTAQVDLVEVSRKVLARIGYHHFDFGFDCFHAEYHNYLHQQSQEIFNSVEDGGAGDQGLMFGYATNETPQFLPLPYYLAQQLMLRQQATRYEEQFKPYLRPDAKSQVTVAYDGHRPSHVTKVVLSSQHIPNIDQEELRTFIKEDVILPIVEPYLSSESSLELLINPSGSFVMGGPNADTGLTGRKIIVDTYGGSAPHGGGAFSGKDPSKVDRSAAYMARYIAKHIVAAELADKCTVQLSYAIGVREPQSVHVDLHGTGRISSHELVKRIQKTFDLTPNGIIATLNLKQPIYLATARNGHFTNPDFSWEQVNDRILGEIAGK